MTSGLRVPTLPRWFASKRGCWRRGTQFAIINSGMLLERLGEDGAGAALRPFDGCTRQTADVSPLAEVAERLAAAAPADIADINLKDYRGLAAFLEQLALRGSAGDVSGLQIASASRWRAHEHRTNRRVAGSVE